jgi:uncharacterized protein YbjT (DUF2867 family)
VIAVAGSTGYVGGKLCARLREERVAVRALARAPERASDLRGIGCDVRQADVLEPSTLDEALEGVDVAYYLVHSMGRGSDGDFAQRDKEGAANFSRAAAAAGVRRIVYLGGLGEGSEHLASRHATAETLRAGTVPVAYFRAAAVIGAGSESFSRRAGSPRGPSRSPSTMPSASSLRPLTSTLRWSARSRSAGPTSPPMAA